MLHDKNFLRVAAAALVALSLQQVLLIDEVRAVYLDYDKWVHALTFFLLTLLFSWALALRPVWVFALMLLLGAFDEGAQYFLPGRTASVGDWLADAAGAGLALVCLLLRPRLRGVVRRVHTVPHR